MKFDEIERSTVTQSISHVNLHYPRKDGDGEAAALLLEACGLVRTQEMDLPYGGTFYRFTSNAHDINYPNNIVYLSPYTPQTQAMIDKARAALGMDTADPDPVVKAFHEANAIDPERELHVGFLVDSLEFLEQVFLKLKDLEANDPRFADRLKIVVNRALPGNPEIDERLDASPIYNGVTRYTFGRNGVQAFCATDLIVDGPLAEGLVIEFDYVFPGYEEHIMSVSEVTPETARV
ncbi:MAG: hypothetical protein PHE36_01130 [Novosphingobium sp.]|nr:hypothetical protein [Novosphingobium sp.]